MPVQLINARSSVIERSHDGSEGAPGLPDFEFELKDGDTIFFYYNIKNKRVVARYFENKVEADIKKFLADYGIVKECKDTPYQIMIFYHNDKALMQGNSMKYPFAQNLLSILKMQENKLNLKKFQETTGGFISLTEKDGYSFKTVQEGEKISPDKSKLPEKYSTSSSTGKGKSSAKATTTTTTTTTTTSSSASKPTVASTLSGSHQWPAYLVSVNDVALIDMGAGSEVTCMLYDGAIALALFDKNSHWLAIAVLGSEAREAAAERAILQCWSLLKTKIPESIAKNVIEEKEWLHQIISPEDGQNLVCLQKAMVEKGLMGNDDEKSHCVFSRPVLRLSSTGFAVVDDPNAFSCQLTQKNWKAEISKSKMGKEIGFLTGTTTAIELIEGFAFQGSMAGRAYYMKFNPLHVVLLSYSRATRKISVMQIESNLLAQWADGKLTVGHHVALLTLSNFPANGTDLPFEIFWRDKGAIADAHKNPDGHVCVSYGNAFPVIYENFFEENEKVFTQREGTKYKLSKLENPKIKGIKIDANTPYLYISLDGDSLQVEARSLPQTNTSIVSWPNNSHAASENLKDLNIKQFGNLDSKVPHNSAAPVETQHS